MISGKSEEVFDGGQKTEHHKLHSEIHAKLNDVHFRVYTKTSQQRTQIKSLFFIDSFDKEYVIMSCTRD